MSWQSILLMADMAALPVIFVGTVWGNYCIYRTFQDRMSSLNSWRFRPITWQPISQAYEAVSFNKHLWAVARLRDPWKLYDPMVLDVIKNPRTEMIGGMIIGEPGETPPAMH